MRLQAVIINCNCPTKSFLFEVFGAVWPGRNMSVAGGKLVENLECEKEAIERPIESFSVHSMFKKCIELQRILIWYGRKKLF